MIPKKIHYCWFGKGKKSNLINSCIESWEKYCPDWEIIEWNESNFDIHQLPYMEEAYEQKKWAFVSDMARLMILYEHGGIYLDTDVELLKPINENILKYDSIFPFEIEVRINTGMGFASKQYNPIIKALIDDYKDRHFIRKNGSLNLEACPYYNTTVLERLLPELKLDNTHQIIQDNVFITRAMYNECAIHHYASSWTENPKTEIGPKQEWKDTKLKTFLRNSKRQQWVRKHLGYKGQRCYEFIAYDLMDVGLIYFVKRIWEKVRRR